MVLIQDTRYVKIEEETERQFHLHYNALTSQLYKAQFDAIVCTASFNKLSLKKHGVRSEITHSLMACRAAPNHTHISYKKFGGATRGSN